MTAEERAAEIADIVAEVARLPLYDAAFALWRQMARLDRLEGRPTDEEVRVIRSLSREQWRAKYRQARDHAHKGPMFGYLKRAHPRAGDAELKAAIVEAVKFDDDCFKYLKWDGDFWDCVVRGGPGATDTSRLSRHHLPRRAQSRRLLHEIASLGARNKDP